MGTETQGYAKVMNEKPVLHTPGEKLTALRLASGRSLDDLAEATKIPPPMLQAIEQDEYHKISGELYVKSFLRAYAAEMGLEAEEILDLYRRFTGTVNGPAAQDGSPIWQEEEIQIKRVGVPWLTLGLVAAAVVVLAAVLFFVLRGGGQESPRQENPVDQAPVPAETSPAQDEGAAEGDSLATTAADPPPVQASPLVAVPARDQAVSSLAAPLPAAVADEPGVLKIGGRTWPVVMRLVCANAREVAVKKDGDRTFTRVDWPASARPLPTAGIKAGLGYQVKEGLAVYWGAEDHFSLKLDSPAGCRVTINGQHRDLGGLGPGQEIILNDPAVIRSQLPSAQNPIRP